MNTITVIIPTYNRLSYLKEALLSCLNQSLLPEEIIIGDDSTNDETEKWIKSVFNPRVKISYFHHYPSLKQADNVEFLIQQVKTEYMLLLHDDDSLLEDSLEKLVAVKEKYSQADVVFGKQYVIDSFGIVDTVASVNINKLFNRIKEYSLIKLDPYDVALKQQLPSNGFLINTCLAQKLHYNFKELAGDAVDFFFCLNLAKFHAVFIYTDQYVSNYRISSNSISANSNAGYYSYILVEELCLKDSAQIILQKKFLENRASVAILEALKIGKKEKAIEIYCSKHHRKMILSLGGVRRGMKIILSLIFEKLLWIRK